MKTFDHILPALQEIFHAQAEAVRPLAPVIVNRDLNGRVRLIVAKKWEDDPAARATLTEICQAMAKALGLHGFPAERAVLFEAGPFDPSPATGYFPLGEVDGVWVIDRLAVEGRWSVIGPVAEVGASRVVFFSIKGGVGRSMALAVAAWHLAETGKRVLVVDLDLESPGLSSSLLSADRRPTFGIADWLVEDLVDNGDTVMPDMVAASRLSRNGDIHVVPAHGADPGEYIAKLGRVWMPKVDGAGRREPWTSRLRRLIDALEMRVKPDVILIDSRAGIDEVASACVTGLGAATVLLFALEGEQTWTGYRVLFRHWLSSGVARDIRERLQFVAAMVPELGGPDYFQSLREAAWTVFSEELYDEVPQGAIAGDEYWNFDEADEAAPHHPWPIAWHRGFAALTSLHETLKGIDPRQAAQVYGVFLENLARITSGGSEVK